MLTHLEINGSYAHLVILKDPVQSTWNSIVSTWRGHCDGGRIANALYGPKSHVITEAEDLPAHNLGKLLNRMYLVLWHLWMRRRDWITGTLWWTDVIVSLLGFSTSGPGLRNSVWHDYKRGGWPHLHCRSCSCLVLSAFTGSLRAHAGSKPAPCSFLSGSLDVE